MIELMKNWKIELTSVIFLWKRNGTSVI